MKIAYIVPSIVHSGPIRVVEHLINGLSKNDEVDLFYLEERNDRQLINFGNRAQKIDFFEAIDFDRYDIVHSHTIKADAYLRWHKKHIKRAKVISTVHNLAYEDLPMQYGSFKGKVLAHLWGRVLRSFDGVVCLTAGAVNYYKKRWRGVRILGFVHNGIDANMKKCKDPNKKIISNTPRKKIGVVASAGGVGERKGIDQVIRTLVNLPEFELYVVGKHTETTAKLKNLARAVGVEDRVFFLGFVEDVNCFIESMDLMVAPSRSEGFSLGLLEIVRARKPLICSDIPSYKEAFHTDEVYFFPLENIEKLSMAIRSAASGEGSARVERAYRRFVEEYTVDAMTKRYRTMYRSLIDSESMKESLQ